MGRVTRLSSLRPERHRESSHGIHPYFGKLDPALARSLIEELSQLGDSVLDPFCGSGTVLHEALMSSRSAIGWDSSALAVLLASAKTVGLDNADRGHLRSLRAAVEVYGSKSGLFREPVPMTGRVPPMPRVADTGKWFSHNALQELGFMKATLDATAGTITPAASLLARTAFSRIIVGASNQQGESVYRAVRKSDEPGRVVELFLAALAVVERGASEFSRLMRERVGDEDRVVRTSDEGTVTTWSPRLAVEVSHRDTRGMPQTESGRLADLVVSSPPYLMSWDYGLYHKFRFYWLELDLDTYEETEIGRHLRRRNDDVTRYVEDMTSAFQSISAALTPSARIALVNAPSVVYGESVDTNVLLGEAGAKAGWRLDEVAATLDIPGPHHGMYGSLATRGTSTAGSRGKQEHVLLFSRTSTPSDSG